MSLNDPISNVLTIIRNGSRARKESVDVPASKVTGEMLRIFKEDGYIEDYREMKDSTQGSFKVYLKYDGKNAVITDLQRISKPGLRVYKEKSKLPRVLNGLGAAIISTSKGLMNDKAARQLNTGGEIICHIW
ncbi:MAG: small subunit ribosomal protein S8 [Lysobacterales bacterium]|jgi:small subunit ribosomal protein S8